MWPLMWLSDWLGVEDVWDVMIQNNNILFRVDLSDRTECLVNCASCSI